MNPMAPPSSAPRVRYLEGQTLRAADLNAEQANRVAMRRRHHLAHHDWGVVAGLFVSPADGSDATSDLVVTPGMAVDGYGRELFLLEAVTVKNQVLKDRLGYPDRSIDVWLVYRRLPATVSGNPVPGRGDVPPVRWLEKAVLRVVNFQPQSPDPTFGVQDVPPDDPALEWPVFLGRVLSPTESLPLDPSTTPVRRWAVLYGEQVETPAGGTRMRVGVSDDGRKTGFAVGLTVARPPDASKSSDTPAQSTASASQGSLAPPAVEAIETLIIDGAGPDGAAPITITRGLAIGPLPDRPEGLLLNPLVEGTSPAPATTPAPSGTSSRPTIPARLQLGVDKEPAGAAPVGLYFDRLDAPPPGDVFWRMYRVLQPNDDKTLPALDQLRIEILNPADKGDPAQSVRGRRHERDRPGRSVSSRPESGPPMPHGRGRRHGHDRVKRRPARQLLQLDRRGPVSRRPDHD